MQDLEICTTTGELKALAASWDALNTFLDAPFGRHPWILACAETLAPESGLFVPMVRKEGVPAAMAPLIRTGGLLGLVYQLGVEDHGEPCDFIYRDGESLDCLTRRLAEANVPLFLTRVPRDSPVPEALQRAYRSRGIVFIRPQKNCPYIEIDGSRGQALDQLPAHLRSDLKRGRRKAEAIGSTSFEIHSPSDEGDFSKLWEESLQVEATGWKGRSRTALRLDQRLGTFYRNYAKRAAGAGILRIAFLQIGSSVAATMIALETNGRLWILKIGYDENFAKCSPGMLLLSEALQYADLRGLKSFEFLGTATDWTRRWTEREREIVTVHAYPYTVRGVAILIRAGLRYLWSHL